MSPHPLAFQSPMPASAETVCQWHTRPGVFERLTPPWANIRIESSQGSVIDGGTLSMCLQEGPLSLPWKARMYGYEAGKKFEDEQVYGPFAAWHHVHRFIPQDESHSQLLDALTFSLPLDFLSAPLVLPRVRQQLGQLFEHRHRITVQDLQWHQRYNPGGVSMNIAVSGATGLVGSALVPFLTAGGHHVRSIVRRKPAPEAENIFWDDIHNTIDVEKLEGLDAVIHLAGENIASGWWTDDKKRQLRDSRVLGTQTLCEGLAKLENPPKVLICASAIGYYGNRADDWVDEASAPGEGFLTDLCVDWEKATEPARQKGIRVVNLRVGIVLTPKGSALGKMLPAFQLGGGGVLGDGHQYMSWIALDDLIGALYHSMLDETVKGPVNGVSPNPVTNREFTKTLGKVLGRPTIFPVPALAIKTLFGEMGETLLLGSTRVAPKVLTDTEYAFEYPDLEGALRHLLGKP